MMKEDDPSISELLRPAILAYRLRTSLKLMYLDFWSLVGRGVPNYEPRLTDHRARVRRQFCLPYTLVGRGGLEPPASALSEQCSNQLSYRPDWRSGGKRGANSVECTCVGLNMSTQSWIHGSAPSRAISGMARLGWAAAWRRTPIGRRGRLAHQH